MPPPWRPNRRDVSMSKTGVFCCLRQAIVDFSRRLRFWISCKKERGDHSFMFSPSMVVMMTSLWPRNLSNMVFPPVYFHGAWLRQHEFEQCASVDTKKRIDGSTRRSCCRRNELPCSPAFLHTPQLELSPEQLESL